MSNEERVQYYYFRLADSQAGKNNKRKPKIIKVREHEGKLVSDCPKTRGVSDETINKT